VLVMVLMSESAIVNSYTVLALIVLLTGLTLMDAWLKETENSVQMNKI
jgi:hypothetical protein